LASSVAVRPPPPPAVPLAVAFVPELADGATKFLGQRLNARAQDVGEAEQHGQADALCFQVHGQLEQIKAAFRFLRGMHRDVATGVHTEVADAPALNIVQLFRILDRPAHSLLPPGPFHADSAQQVGAVGALAEVPNAAHIARAAGALAILRRGNQDDAESA
jgi:hypothetical protein